MMSLRNYLYNIYYDVLKPLLPRKSQIFIRRIRANNLRKNSGEVWPIDERTGEKPSNWPGWPERKQFALILTHDVESAIGVERCLSLMELEKKHGFTSSFNFVPHGYFVSQELRRRLTAEGFEIGVHGLNHHGNMFRNRSHFQLQSVEINKYLKNWESVGFRAPSMYHNLNWILELDIEYDMSTFDTDPFEPQPDAIGTIFPFIVSGNNSRPGYVELPYTLPQDFTLFIVFKEKDVGIWKRKLSWIAQRGGMALVNVHPDYINFDGNGSNILEYPVELYEDFLKYIRSAYPGMYWNVLPREVARFCRSLSGSTT